MAPAERKPIERMSPAETRWEDHYRDCGHCFNGELCPYGRMLFTHYRKERRRGR